MPRRRDPAAPDLTRQANIRLTLEESEVLDAFIHANHLSGASEALREIVTEFLQKQADEPDIRLALESRAVNRAKKSGKLSGLSKRAGRKTKSA